MPELQGSISGDYSWPVGNYDANVGADWNYTSNQYDVTNYLLPSYTTVDVRAGVKWNNYTLNLFVKNLADKRAIVGDLGYYAGFNPYTVTIIQPLTVGVAFSQHF